jgi:hypothetical protein
LLGDPALRIAGNTAGHPSDETFAQWRWQHFTPDELADSVVSGPTDANFLSYALGEGELLAPELSTASASDFPRMSSGSGFILNWKRRIQRSDIDYQLWISGNLQQWEANAPDIQTLSVEPDADGLMETVRTWVDCPESNRIFVGIKAAKK